MPLNEWDLHRFLHTARGKKCQAHSCVVQIEAGFNSAGALSDGHSQALLAWV